MNDLDQVELLGTQLAAIDPQIMGLIVRQLCEAHPSLTGALVTAMNDALIVGALDEGITQ